jgi:hypothetical protein
MKSYDYSTLLRSYRLNRSALTLDADSAALNCTRDGNFIQNRALSRAKGRECLLSSISLAADYVIVFLTAVLFTAGLAGSGLSNRA